MSTRILFAGDTGANFGHKHLLVKAAARNGCSHVYQSGDAAYGEFDDIGRHHLDNVAAVARAAGVTYCQIDGNHEAHRQLWDTYRDAARSPEGFWRLRSGLYYIPRGNAWTVEGVRFLGLGGAYSVDKARRLEIERETGRPGTMWSPDEELTDEDVVRAIATGPADIMFTHDKPRSTNPGSDFKSFPECWPNQDKVSQVMHAAAPKLLIHGHLHFPYEDHVRVGEEGDWCRVISLESDELGSRNRPYDPRNSWLILEVAGGQFEITVMPPALVTA